MKMNKYIIITILLMISINNLTFSYDNENPLSKSIFKNLSIDFDCGNRYIITGLNGTGKSTLLKLIGGKKLTPYDSVKVSNKDPFRDTSCNKDIAYINNDWGTQTVAFTGYNMPLQSSLKVKDMMTKIKLEYPNRNKELIYVLGINEEWAMNEISEGQRKRVQLYLSLISPFKVCLLDEITVNLDILVKHRFMNYLKKESIVNNACILYITHIFDGLDDWYTHLLYLKRDTSIIATTKESIIASQEKNIYNFLLQSFLKESQEENTLTEKPEQELSKYTRNAGGFSNGTLINYKIIK